jgi:cytosol alanyl aminopeptidase
MDTTTPEQTRPTAERRRGRLPHTTLPRRYELILRLDPREPRFTGEVSIELDLAAETGAIHLHARNVRIERASLHRDGSQVAIPSIRPATGDEGEGEAGETILGLASAVGPGPARLDLAFEAPFDAQLAGLYRVKDAGQWYAFTQFEAADARRCFPCFDEPAFKVPFQVTLEVPEGMEALANMPEIRRENRDGSVRVTFEETPPTPTYLVAFAAGPLEIVEGERYDGGRVPIRAVVPAGKGRYAKTALSFIPGLLRVLEDYFGRPYPFPKLDVVAVPEFGAGAMENSGLITFREELLLADPASLTRARQRLIAEVMAHEIAHHWFGNLVTMEWWEDLWLNEAFATWMAAKAVDSWRPQFDQVMDLLLGRAMVMETDSLPAARKVRQEVETVGEAEQAFDGLTYVKGAAVLTMLEQWVGETAFRDGVRAYLNENAWGNATAADLFAHLDEKSGRDVTGVARTFLDQPGVPQVQVAPVDGRATISQRPYSLLGLDPPGAGHARWRVPVNLGGTWHLVEDESQVVTSGASVAGVHPNAGEWAYYRWSVPDQALLELGRGAKALDVRSRLGILDNAWAMVASGALAPDVYLEVLSLLRTATERPILEELVSGVSHIDDVWETQARTDAFRAWTRSLLGPHGARLGLEPADGEDEDDTVVRPKVLRALGRIGREPVVRSGAFERAEAWLEDAASVSSDVASVCLALSAEEGRVGFETLRDRLADAEDPEIRLTLLRALGMLPEGEAITAALDLTLTDAVRAQDFYYVFRGALARPATRPQAFAWLKASFEGVKARQPEFTFVHIGQIVGSCRTEAERDDVAAFLRSKKIAGGERAIRQGEERATHAIALRAAGEAALDAFLARSP